MKKILGLDLGTNSIGWAVVSEAENPTEQSSIIKLGVRVNPLTVDEKRNFEQGKSITTNADRTLKRSMRRNLQRYKLRRDNLIEVLKTHGFITEETILAEQGNRTTFQTLGLRAKAASEEVTLEELSRILLSINKKRGYKSSRKTKGDDEGNAIDGMETAQTLHDRNLTPGEFAFELLQTGASSLPEFYRSDLQAEFDRIWSEQQKYYPDILTESLKEQLSGKNEKQTWSICKDPFGIEGVKREKKGKELQKENYEWRAKALKQQIDLESLAVVLQKVNSQINASSGYLGDISDRSKELYFNKQTVGQYMMAKLAENPNVSLKNMVFYRQDYIDEFETIWNTQKQYHNELTDELKKEIRDVTIFYQRPLKSQKWLVSFCEFENRNKVIPKSSPLFQEFKIWQVLNNLKVNDQPLEQDEKELLFKELNIKDKLTKADILKLLGLNPKENALNYKEIQGNTTLTALFKAYSSIIETSGHGEHDFSKMPAADIYEITESIFTAFDWNTELLHFDSTLSGKEMENQPLFRLWHLLYSYEGDNSKSGNDRLIEKISALGGFPAEYAKLIAGISFVPDYGSLSAKAISRILPFMQAGNEYSLACEYAGYRHSKKSLTKEELDAKEYKERLEALPKNSLRNPVVEKILNQMINVVNEVIDTYGKPDEIRIELARELKKSSSEREELSKAISKAAAYHENSRKKLQEEFGIANVSRNDIIRYKLYEELKENGYKTLYSNTYIPREKLFSKEFDIEHIIPQAKLFDDSFSNKTLEARQVNIDKSNATAMDFVAGRYNEEEYKARVESLYKNKRISKAKYSKLLMREADIPSDFINRDLRDSQYIAKKSREILEDIVKFVVPTTGSVTDRLREDWQLVNVMQELNWEKYDKLGLTYEYKDKDGRTIRKIKDWTKRNDHRHHAMDALTIAFTKRSHIQYLNNLNARIQKSSDLYINLDEFDMNDIKPSERTAVVMAIEKQLLYRDDKGKLRFAPPIPLDEFRKEAKRHLADTLVSIKAKNKVVTSNVNVTKKKGGDNRKVQLTPRGQLHNESIYGSIRQYVTKEEKVGTGFNADKIATVTIKRYRDALLQRLAEFGNDPKKAFTGKNSLEKNPVFTDNMHTEQVPVKVKTVSMETVYTIRKIVSFENFGKSGSKKLDKEGVLKKLNSIIDRNVRDILIERFKESGFDAQIAFNNLEENPIWLNKEKGIQIKRVKITGISNAEPIHGNHDFVSTSNNHHISIYKDADGNLQEQVVSFYEAVARVSMGQPVIDREYKKDEGWEFLFTMKQNEYFVFPNEETGFDPNEIDLMNPDNYALISPNLFRVQKLASKYYVFRHHLETNVEDKTELRNITWKSIRNTNGLQDIVKVRINHLGQIVHVGEY